jgi:magnesium transporter
VIKSIQSRAEAKPETLTGIFENSLIYVEKPTQKELNLIAKEFLVNANTLRDALDPYEAPRFETDNGATYVFVRYPHQGKGDRTTIPFLIVVAQTGILTIAQEEPPFMDKFFSGTVHFDASQRVDLILKLLLEVNNLYGHGITEIQRAVNRKKQSINRISESDIVELTTHEMGLNDYMDALVPQTATLTKLLAGKIIEIDATAKENIEDLILSLLKTTADIRSAYTAISTQRLSIVIQRLTALTVLVTIPNVITGFFGMNIHLPFADYPNAALFVFVAVGCIVLAIALLLKRSRWL